MVMERKWSWVEYIAQTRGNRWTKDMIDWSPMDKCRSRGRPKKLRDAETKKSCGGAICQRVVTYRLESQRMKQIYCDVGLCNN